jgi:hypothetical protein
MLLRWIIFCGLLYRQHHSIQLVKAAGTIPTPIRINVGGDAYTDPSGVVWKGDNRGAFLSTNVNSYNASNCPRSIQATTNDNLYCSYRWFASPSVDPYRYTIPVVSNTKYTVRLHFSEAFYTKIGDRVFDIYIEGELRASGFDILQNAKDNLPNTAYTLTTTTKTDVDGRIIIEFVKRIENPSINGIEIIPLTQPTAPVQLPVPSLSIVPPTKAPLSSPTPLNDQRTIRINVGGDAYRDTTGILWQSDNNGSYLSTKLNSFVSSDCPKAIMSTINDALYCSYRWFSDPTILPYRYNIPVLNHMRYKVRLHFSELFYTEIGQRKFDIYVEGEIRSRNFDILQNSKNNLPNTAYILSSITKVVTDGFITIEFVRIIENPMINGIEIVPIMEATPPVNPPTNTLPVTQPTVKVPFTIRINAGSATSFTDSNTGKIWLMDNVTQYTKGSSKTFGAKNMTSCFANIANTFEDRLYCTQRYFLSTTTPPFQYNIPVPNGRTLYNIILHFAEIYHVLPGKRVFNVFVEGALVVTNLDVYQLVRSNTAYVVSTRQYVSDGSVTIDFTSNIGEPFISGIEIVEVISSPVLVPASAPVMPPIQKVPSASVPISSPPTNRFSEIVINCGGKEFMMLMVAIFFSSDFKSSY